MATSKLLKKISPLIIICTALLFAGCSGEQEPSQSTQLEMTSEPQFEKTSATPTYSLETTEDPFVEARQNMVENTIESRGVKNPDVLRAMRDVPRHEFVPDDYISQSYADHPLPIGYGQTISQPYIVALMTELLELQTGEKVLEIGTGSGYQAAVLGELGYVDVYSIEIVPELAASAADKLESLGYDGVKVIQGDGYYGWQEHAPFDAIIVTAAPDHLPAPLVEQLVEGGRIVVPIGPPGGYQTLWKFVNEAGEIKAYNLGGVSFVPFTGEGVKDNPADSVP
jgi:protein-L-isoaspartate(D-aspartate) O-methyltransferase